MRPLRRRRAASARPRHDRRARRSRAAAWRRARASLTTPRLRGSSALPADSRSHDDRPDARPPPLRAAAGRRSRRCASARPRRARGRPCADFREIRAPRIRSGRRRRCRAARVARASPTLAGTSRTKVRSGMAVADGDALQRRGSVCRRPCRARPGRRASNSMKRSQITHLPCAQRRPDGAAHMIVARGGKQHRLGLRAERLGDARQQNVADDLGARRAARLAREHDVEPERRTAVRPACRHGSTCRCPRRLRR